MLCPNCKKTIEDGVQFCPDCGANLNQPVNPVPANTPPAKQKKPITKKWWFWVLIVLAVFVVIGVAGGSDDETDTTVDNDVVVQSDETTTVAETTTVKTNFVHGDSVYDGNLKITYVSSEEWNDYDQYFGPKDGNKIIRLKFDFVNEGDTDCYINTFYCYADNQAAEGYYYADDSISAFTISAGRTTSGYVYFEVPENADKIEVEYEVNVWSDKKAIFEVIL